VLAISAAQALVLADRPLVQEVSGATVEALRVGYPRDEASGQGKMERVTHANAAPQQA
jgi:hypothetical protein